MTNNPAIHRRPSGDVDIAVPHDGPEPSADAGSATPETVAAASVTAPGTDTA